MFLISGLLVFHFNSCQEREGADADPPIVTTARLFDISHNGVQTGGEVMSTGGAFTTRGVVWSTQPNPTVDLSTRTSDGIGSGPFGSSIKKLQPLTTYFVRAYATNFRGTTYGDEISFTTLSRPLELETHAVTQITATTAVSGGVVPNDGVVISRGLIWSTSPDLSFSLETKTNEGGGTGVFTSTLTGLSPQTTYYVKAYAVRSWSSYGEGTVTYGPVIRFNTTQ